MSFNLVIGIALFALSCPSAAQADDRFSHPHWFTTCKSENVCLHFDSKSGNSDEDDMEVQIQFRSKKMHLDAQPGLSDNFGVNPLTLNSKLCNNLPSIKVGSNLLVFFKTDDRPNLDQLSALLLDPEKQKILSFEPRLGAILNIKIQPAAGGVRVLLNQGWRSKGDTDGPERLLPGWKKISVKDDKIQARWDKSLPSGYGEY